MKTLQQLIEGLPVSVTGPIDVSISDITFDSRKVQPGSLFVALKGVHQDGRGFIPGAIASGARAILTEGPASVSGATLVNAADPLQVLAPISVRFWDAPSEKLLTVGITGTNGKTTTAYLMESILNAAGLAPAVLGTINYRYPRHVQPAPNTTPFASELQRFMADALAHGCQSCVMEVSSHALELGRVAGVDFDVAVFTNLTQDHLDFHKTVEAYGEAKARLFRQLSPKSSKKYPRVAVLNRDDPWSARMEAVCQVPVVGYGLKASADVTATHVEYGASGSRFEIHTKKGLTIPIQLALLGEYNVYNALAAAAVAISQNVKPEAIVKGLESIRGVPGRMERVDGGRPFSVIVDYAHTEDALRNVLNALRRLQPARILTVFGCGGDRDRVKRPLMGEVAARLSDEIFLTSDNPRSEDPSRITLDVEVGIRKVRADHYQIIPDRTEAIHQALSQARPGDVVLIAGKGHETYQILSDRTIPFDDKDVVQRWLRGSSNH